MQSYTKDVH